MKRILDWFRRRRQPTVAFRNLPEGTAIEFTLHGPGGGGGSDRYVTPPEAEALAAKRTTLAPGWRKRRMPDVIDECSDCNGYATHTFNTPERLWYCCPPCARARGAFLVEVLEKGAES